MLFTSHKMLYNKLLLYAIENLEFLFFPLGAQGPADRYSSPEHSGGALQLAAFS